MTHYIIADNQELTRAGLQAVIKEKSPGEMTIADDKTELILQLKENPASIVLLDYTLFDFTDADNLLIVADRYPQSQWILVSEDLTADFIAQIYFANHNMSILFKDTSVNDVINALRAAQGGNRYISQRVTELLLAQRQKEGHESNLTQTEIEILKAISQGKTTKEIANERISSVHTINTHRKNIFRKIGVNSAHEAIKYAFRSGLVDTSEFYI